MEVPALGQHQIADAGPHALRASGLARLHQSLLMVHRRRCGSAVMHWCDQGPCEDAPHLSVVVLPKHIGSQRASEAVKDGSLVV